MKLVVQIFQDYSFSTRVLLHAIMWLGMFCLLLLLLKLPLQGDLLAPSFHVFIVALLAIVAVNHYTVAYGLAALAQRGSWVLVAVSLVGLYVFSAYASNLCLGLLAHLFQENKVFLALFTRYRIQEVSDIMSLNTFTWVMSFVFPFCMFTLFMKFYKKNLDTSRRNLSLQKANSELELSFLRSQINPHFFFNTLNSLYSLVFDNERAAKIILDLSDIMRFSLYEAKAARIALAREVRFLTDYIQLEELRHDSRVAITYNFDTAGCEDVELPPLLLVNFIENAFKHGINSTVDKAWVNVRLCCEDQF